MQSFPLKCVSLCRVSLLSGVLRNTDTTLLEAALHCAGRAEAAVSTGVSGETGGTVYSVEMRRSLVCSGTGKTPERCFGNSGGNWSADNLSVQQARPSLHPKAPCGASCLEAPGSGWSPGCAAALLQHRRRQPQLPLKSHWSGHRSAVVGGPVVGLPSAVGGLWAADVGSAAVADSCRPSLLVHLH